MRANITVRRTVAAALAAPMLAFVAAGTADAAPQTVTSVAPQAAVTNYVQGGGGGFGGIGGFRGNGFYGNNFYGGFVPAVVVPVVVPIGGFGGGFGGGFFPFR
ncbi:hypothetical protein OG539_15365 [Actinacidiphila glaucinigra]|uniref:hypothetical protein n=1 Tax=Actinacidiphila glaucinigra TaxID=235986 RepID=UPI002DDAE2CA|nr:hypothetical protein [Actinacidiphila glaucinigra]WSD62336.1 hypothetical protein OIE69_27365 [Actinacidiphila glaucinigra]